MKVISAPGGSESPSSKAAGSAATEAYPQGTLQRRRTTENAGGGFLDQAALAGLAVEDAGLIPRNVEFNILLVDPLVPVHPVLIRVIEHRVVPPIK